METYHKIILLVAASMLILFLLTIGFMIPRDNSDAPWPPVAGRCPDGWIEDINRLNKCTPQKCGLNTGLLNTDTCADVKDFNTVRTICDKKKWAVKYGVQWDGVSNYNKCKK